MKRPQQHVTDSRADAIFRAAFSEWGVNGVERDYGRDYVVEVFRNGTTTGILFNAQLKGSLNTEYSSDRTFLSQSLSRDAADYLARQLQQPTFLFHADVSRGRIFWSAIQLDRTVLAALERGDTHSLTVRIPTANVLSADLGQFLNDLTRCQSVVVSRTLLGTKAGDFIEAMRGQPIEHVTKTAEDLHQKGFRLSLDAAHGQMQSGDLRGAISSVKTVLASSSGFLEVQFNATSQLGDLEMVELIKSDQPQSLVPARKLATAKELCRIAHRSPKHLHLFAQTTKKAAELAVAVHKVIGLLMSWRGHSLRGDDSLWLTVVSFQLNESLLAAHRKYRQSLRLAQAIASSRFRWITSRPLADIAVPIATLAALLESCGFKEASSEYRSSAFQVVKLSAAIATENRNMDELFNALANARTLEPHEQGGVVFQWIRSIVDGWTEGNIYRTQMEELLARWTARQNGATFEGDIQTNHRQIHYNILTSAGIDPTIEPWLGLIELAIRDDDPTRILKDCRYKQVSLHPGRDPMLERLALEHANPKIINCGLHRYALGGRELDKIDERFREQYCKICAERVPHPADWSYFGDATP